jgi:hypothetical protein
MKIAFTGPTSSGKTTTAQQFIKACPAYYFPSVQTEEALRRMGLRSHAEVKGLGPEGARQFQRNLMLARHELFATVHNMVTDRSAIDAWVYYCTDALRDDEPARATELRAECAARMDEFNFVVHLPFGGVPVEAAERRINNAEFHRMTDLLYTDFLTSNVDETKILWMPHHVKGISERVQWVMDAVNRYCDAPVFDKSVLDAASYLKLAA